MKSYCLKKLNSNYELESFDYNIKGLQYPIKSNKRSVLKIKEVIIVNPEIISNLICHNFNKKYQKIIEYFFNNSDFDDDNTGTNLMIALDEVTRLRTIIINKYNKFLKHKKEEELLKKLKLLENELRIKIIDYKLIKEQELNKKENKSR